MSIEGRKDNRSFEIPDMSGRQPVYENGATIGNTTNGAAPNIRGVAFKTYGQYSDLTFKDHVRCEGAFYEHTNNLTGGFSSVPNNTNQGHGIGLNANLASAVYSDSATGIVPAGVYMNWIIKAF